MFAVQAPACPRPPTPPHRRDLCRVFIWSTEWVERYGPDSEPITDRSFMLCQSLLGSESAEVKALKKKRADKLRATSAARRLKRIQKHKAALQPSKKRGP